MMSKVIHVVDDNVIHTMVDDHVRKTNPLEKVVSTPKIYLRVIQTKKTTYAYLTNKTVLMIMAAKGLNIRINNNLFTSKTFRNEIIHIAFAEKQKQFSFDKSDTPILPAIGMTIFFMITIFTNSSFA